LGRATFEILVTDFIVLPPVPPKLPARLWRVGSNPFKKKRKPVCPPNGG